MTSPDPYNGGWLLVGIVWLGYSALKSAVDSYKEKSSNQESAVDEQTRTRILFGIRKLLDLIKERR